MDENMDSNSVLETFKALVDDAFRDAPLNLRQDKAAAILDALRLHLRRLKIEPFFSAPTEESEEPE